MRCAGRIHSVGSGFPKSTVLIDYSSLPPSPFSGVHVSLHPAQSIRERPSGSVSLLQQPRSSPRRMCPTPEYLHHPTRPPDVRSLPPYSSSRPVPIRGHGTRLKLGAPHPPDLSAPRVRCLCISTIRARLRGRSSRRRSLASCVSIGEPRVPLTFPLPSRASL